MRPLRLSLAGFTCFRDPQPPLDLEGLDLVAIAGPTGAGKSSLLDAMIFALYGNVPRMGKKNLAELISLGRDRMTVTFDFRLAGVDYRVVRVAHRSRTRATQVMLERIVDGGETKPIAEGVKGVNEAVKERLGFDYDTFTRAVILPQGEFAAFLKSEPAKRRQILRDLLRLQIYEEMRRLATAEAARHRDAIANTERRLEEDFADATALELETRRLQVKTLRAGLENAEEKLGVLRLRFDEQSKARDKSRELEDERRRAAELDKRVEEIEELERRLETARRAAPLLPRLETLAELRAEAEEKRGLAEREATARKQAETAHDAARKKLDAARQESAEVPALRQQLERLDRVLGLIEPRDKARRDAATLAAEHDRHAAELATLRARRTAKGKEHAKLEKALDKARREVETIGYDAELDARLDAVRETASRLADRRRERDEREKRARETAEAEKRANKAVRDAEAAAKKTQKRHDAAVDTRRRAETERQEAERHSHVALLRRGLSAGASCPVCEQPIGKPPAPPDLSALDRLDRALETARAGERETRQAHEDARRRLAVVRSELETATARAADARRRSEALEREIEDALGTLEDVAADVAGERGETLDARILAAVQRLAKERARHDAARTELRELEKRLAEVERERDRTRGETETLERRIEELVTRIQTAEREAAGYDRKIREVTTAEDPAAERRAAEKRIETLETAERQAAEDERQRELARAAAAERATRAKSSSETAAKKLAGVEKRARRAIADAGFDDEPAVRAAALTPGEEARLDREIRDYRQTRHASADRIAKLETQLGGVFVTAEDLETRKTELAAAETRERDERTELAKVEGSLGELERRVERRAKLERELEELRAARGLAHQLAQDLRGENFQAYLLEKTNRELVHGASTRLLELSQDRYELRFEADRYLVVDHENASQERSTDTLSGGETFLASLSLALELSEQIQREAGAVTLDSIFIDEGFGTLDPETLETVAGAIEALPVGGRMVGLITHIPELTRRLPYRIVVERHATGSRYRVEEG